MFDPRVIANAVLDRAEERGLTVTNLDMQKIVYFLHGHFLRRHGRPLVVGEFEAWQYGPVHRVLYDAFKRFEDGPIEARADRFDPIRQERKKLPRLDDSAANVVIGDVVDRYLDMPTWTLVAITHGEGTPWQLTMEQAQRRVNVGMRIPNALIAERFEGDTVRSSHADQRRVTQEDVKVSGDRPRHRGRQEPNRTRGQA